MKEKTFAIIKPDVVLAKNSGKVIDLVEENGFDIVKMEKISLSKEKAEEFYSVHKDRPFFSELVEFMTSGPVVVMAIEKENAVPEWRKLMGETDSQKALPGTVRYLFGTDKGKNAVHGSDAVETAKTEIQLFFPELT